MVVKYVLNRDRGVLHIKTCFAAKNIFHSEVPTVFFGSIAAAASGTGLWTIGTWPRRRTGSGCWCWRQNMVGLIPWSGWDECWIV